MQKQAPTLGRLLTMVVFALSCFGLILFLWVSFGGPIPLEPVGYRIHATFPEATQLGLEADVRIAGVSVGKVVKKDIDPAKYPNRTIATLEIDPKFAPIASDARAILRQKTLLGETYVELTPGTPGAPKIKEGGFLANSQVKGTVQLDEIFKALDPTTRKAFRQWQQDLSIGVQGRGQDLNDALGNLPQFAADANDVLGVLDEQSSDVRRLIRNTGVVFSSLSRNEGRLHALIVNSGNLFDATSNQQKALAQTFQIFPTFLDESRKTFTLLDTFSRETDPLIRDLEPVAHALTPTLRDVRALAPDLVRLFRRLDPLIKASKKGLPALHDVLEGVKPVLAQVQPFLEQLNPILQWLEYNQRLTSDFLSNGAGALENTIATRTSNEVGHYLRQFGPAGMDTLSLFTQRPADSRGNAYLAPNANSGPKHARYMIFPNTDCKNTGKSGDGTYMTQIPNTTDIPSCFVATPPPVPAGNTLEVPHIGAADYSK